MARGFKNYASVYQISCFPKPIALRGHEERLSNDCDNPGNFLFLLKLVGQYDPIISDHLKYARDNPKSVTYLSPEIQNEFISILANSVRNRLYKTSYKASTMVY